MSRTGLPVFDSTLQKTNIWLDDIGKALGLDDRQQAYLALRGVLHVLRDQLTVAEVAQLSAQLPMLIRGIYLEGWVPSGKARRARDKGAFLSYVYHELTPGFDDSDLDVERVTRAVFQVLAAHVSAGEIDDVRHLLSKDVRALWPVEEHADETVVPGRAAG